MHSMFCWDLLNTGEDTLPALCFNAYLPCLKLAERAGSKVGLKIISFLACSLVMG
jgi:hypothetical protein